MKNKILIIILLVVAIAIFAWWQLKKSVIPPVSPGVVEIDDTTLAIDQDLENLEIKDLDKEFEEVDADIKSL